MSQSIGSTDPAYALAAMRATGTVQQPGRGPYVTWSATARDAGRALVPVTGLGQDAVALGWPQGVNTSPDDDDPWIRAVPRKRAILVFAAALGCCWPDPATDPYPGQPAREADVLAAYLALDDINADDDEPGTGSRLAHANGNVRLLRAAGLLAPDVHDGYVRLGWQVAAWSRAQIQHARDLHPSLPTPPAAAVGGGGDDLVEEAIDLGEWS
jgi:hypothetical protein